PTSGTCHPVIPTEPPASPRSRSATHPGSPTSWRRWWSAGASARRRACRSNSRRKAPRLPPRVMSALSRAPTAPRWRSSKRPRSSWCRSATWTRSSRPPKEKATDRSPTGAALTRRSSAACSPGSAAVSTIARSSCASAFGCCAATMVARWTSTDRTQPATTPQSRYGTLIELPVNRQNPVDTAELLRELRIDREGRPSRTRRRWLILALIAIVVLAAALWVAWSRLSASTVRTVTARAAAPAGGAASILDASGYVTARRQATVSAKITGKVTEVLIEEGMRVSEGAVLARLDDTEAKAQLALARAQLAAARSQDGEIRA